MIRKPLYISTLYREKWGSLGWLICFPISALKYKLCILVRTADHQQSKERFKNQKNTAAFHRKKTFFFQSKMSVTA